MLMLKLKKKGKRDTASMRLIASDKRSKLDGKYVDDLGWFNPHSDDHSLDKDRIEHWLKSGAKPTAAVHNLLVRAKIISASKIAVHKKAKVKKDESAAAGAAPIDKTKAAC